MAETHKSFASNRKKAALTFDLPVFDRDDNEIIETFHCKKRIPVNVVTAFFSELKMGDAGISQPDPIAFLRLCLATEALVRGSDADGSDGVYEDADDLDRFNALVDPQGDRDVEAQALMQAALWIANETYGRPTNRPRL